MAGVSGDKAGLPESVKDADKAAESPAARRRRIEKMREKQELRAMLDDFGDGELDIDIDLEQELEDDEADSRWVAAGDDEDVELDEAALSDDDDDFVDDEFEDED
jgi:hypothetical protein